MTVEYKLLTIESHMKLICLVKLVGFVGMGLVKYYFQVTLNSFCTNNINLSYRDQ